MALQTGDYVDVPSCNRSFYLTERRDTIIIHTDLALGNL